MQFDRCIPPEWHDRRATRSYFAGWQNNLRMAPRGVRKAPLEGGYWSWVDSPEEGTRDMHWRLECTSNGWDCETQNHLAGFLTGEQIYGSEENNDEAMAMANQYRYSNGNGGTGAIGGWGALVWSGWWRLCRPFKLKITTQYKLLASQIGNQVNWGIWSWYTQQWVNWPIPLPAFEDRCNIVEGECCSITDFADCPFFKPLYTNSVLNLSREFGQFVALGIWLNVHTVLDDGYFDITMEVIGDDEGCDETAGEGCIAETWQPDPGDPDPPSPDDILTGCNCQQYDSVVNNVAPAEIELAGWTNQVCNDVTYFWEDLNGVWGGFAQCANLGCKRWNVSCELGTANDSGDKGVKVAEFGDHEVYCYAIETAVRCSSLQECIPLQYKPHYHPLINGGLLLRFQTWDTSDSSFGDNISEDTGIPNEWQVPTNTDPVCGDINTDICGHTIPILDERTWPICVGGEPVADDEEFTSPGDHNFVVPAGVTTLTSECWGPGGGGGGGNGSAGAGGGGGGGYVRRTFSVTPGETLTVRVGQAGVGGGPNTRGTGSQAGSAFTTAILRSGTLLAGASGGAGGFQGGGAGGDGGPAMTGGDVTSTALYDEFRAGGQGGQGGNNSSQSTGGGGGGGARAGAAGGHGAASISGGAGGNPGGGNGGTLNTNNAQPGDDIGGGGGGAGRTTSPSLSGANGYNGKARLAWTATASADPQVISASVVIDPDEGTG